VNVTLPRARFIRGTERGWGGGQAAGDPRPSSPGAADGVSRRRRDRWPRNHRVPPRAPSPLPPPRPPANCLPRASGREYECTSDSKANLQGSRPCASSLPPSVLPSPFPRPQARCSRALPRFADLINALNCRSHRRRATHLRRAAQQTVDRRLIDHGARCPRTSVRSLIINSAGAPRVYCQQIRLPPT